MHRSGVFASGALRISTRVVSPRNMTLSKASSSKASSAPTPVLRDRDTAAVSVAEAKSLFAAFKDVPSLLMAVSGGPDSVALMVLAARWRDAIKRGPRLIAVTVDHGLRRASAAEAQDVSVLAKRLGIDHHTLRWGGTKPKTGLPAAARAARYQLMMKLARTQGATHLLTAHTRDDQAETVLMRLSRGSGVAGLAAMARQSERDGLILARPFLDVPKSRLIATLAKSKIPFALDPTNQDIAFTRPRLRALMPELAKEGCDARNLVRFASRLARANQALEAVADAAVRALVHLDPHSSRYELDAELFFTIPDEIRLRVLTRAIDAAGREGPAELGKVEALLDHLDQARKGPKTLVFKRTLAGSVVSLGRNLLSVSPAPPRRGKSGR
jgi:tRNA(Ile)-lysidine synthase